MKTAFEMIDEATGYGGIAQTKEDLANLMKSYAKQVAQQALNDAAERAVITKNQSEEWHAPTYSVDKNSIRNTPIKLP